jgi:ABC-type uncharacterized transport system substrate-binding protein
LAAELVRRQVSVIAVTSTPGAMAAKAATATTPIVFAIGADPDQVRSDIRAAADSVGVQLHVLRANGEEQFGAAFDAAVRLRVGAILIASDPFFLGRRGPLVSLAARHAVPTFYTIRAYAAAGGPASYAADQSELYNQTGIYAGRVLKGEKPADLPVLQPTKFELVINMRTAKALGLKVPLTLQAAANEVIE